MCLCVCACVCSSCSVWACLLPLSQPPTPPQTKLNDRYIFDVITSLRWRVDGSGHAVMTVDSEVPVDVDPPAIFRTIPRPVLTRLGTEVMKLALKKVESSL